MNIGQKKKNGNGTAAKQQNRALGAMKRLITVAFDKKK